MINKTCPRCYKPLTILEKIKLADIRYKHRCSHCSTKLMLPRWYVIISYIQTLVWALLVFWVFDLLNTTLYRVVILFVVVSTITFLNYIFIKRIPILLAD